MVEAIRQQLAAHGLNIAPERRKPSPAPKSSSGPSPAQQAREIEAQVALVPRGPVKWELATGLHAQQYAGRFRLVVTGHELDLPAVLQVLAQLSQP